MTIFVATYEHPHGTDVKVFATEESAELWRQRIAQEWWENGLDRPMPEAETPEQIANLYFEAMQDRMEPEYFTVHHAEIES